MSLAEIMAKKRAVANVTPAVENSFVAALNIPSTIIKEEVAATQVEKPMSFAERMLLKKVKASKQSSTLAPVETVLIANIPAPADITTHEDQLVSLPNVSQSSVSVETEQAYADISKRIEALASLSDTNLEIAMSELKIALLANPNAVSLMEDTDYGKMVIALRSMTKEAATDALKEKISGKKSKSKLSLSPEDVAAAFEEI